jgi:hypothetical protein
VTGIDSDEHLNVVDSGWFDVELLNHNVPSSAEDLLRDLERAFVDEKFSAGDPASLSAVVVIALGLVPVLDRDSGRTGPRGASLLLGDEVRVSWEDFGSPTLDHAVGHLDELFGRETRVSSDLEADLAAAVSENRSKSSVKSNVIGHLNS